MAVKYTCEKCGASITLAEAVDAVKCPACEIPMGMADQAAETESDKSDAEQKKSTDHVTKPRKTAKTVSSGTATGSEAARHTAELKVAKPVAETTGYTTTDTARALVNKAEQDAREIRAAAEKDAEATKQQIIDAAKKEADKLKSEATKEAERESQKTAGNIKKEARETAEKIKANAQSEAGKLKKEAAENRAKAQKTLQDAEKQADKLKQQTKKSAGASKQQNTTQKNHKREPQKAGQPVVGAVQKKEINVHLKREARFLLAGISFSLVILLFCFLLVTQADLGGAFRMMTYVVIILDCALFGSLSWIVWGHYKAGKDAMERHKKRQAEQRLERRNAKKNDAGGQPGRVTNAKKSGARKNEKTIPSSRKSTVNKTKHQGGPPKPGRNKKQ